MENDYTKIKCKTRLDIKPTRFNGLKAFMVALFICSVTINQSYATDYYINDNTTGEAGALCSSAGNDANPGTAALPKATLTSLRASLLPGDKVFIDLGTYNWGTAGYIGTSGGNGTAANHIKIIGVDSVNTVVKGTTSSAFYLDGANFSTTSAPTYWDFSSIKFTGVGQNSLQVSGPKISFMTFTDCVFESTGRAAIETPAGPAGLVGGGFDNVSFTNCRIQSNIGALNFTSSNVGLTNMFFIGCKLFHTGANTTTALGIGNGIMNNFTFDKCTIISAGTGNIFNMPGGQYNDWKISNCKIRGSGSGNALQLNGGSTYINFSVFNNYISKVVIGVNIVGVANASGMSYQFNSFYTSGTCLAADGGQSGGTYIRNNNFYTTGATAYCVKLINSAAPTTMDYNLYYAPNGKVGSNAGTDYTTLSNWKNVVNSNDAHSVAGDPLYANAASGDLSTTCATPGFHAGITVATITTDILNVTRANPGPSIGATEGGGASGPITVSPSISTVCAGTQVTLTVSGGVNYSWSPATGLDATTGATVIAAPTQTTTYTVSSGVGGCAATATAVINIKTSPVIDITPANPVICGTGTATITASGADSYIWTPATGLNTTTGNEVIADITSTATFTVTGTGLNGCETSKDVTVTVASKPTVNVSAVDALLCKGESTEISASGAVTYSWFPDLGLNQATGESVTSTPTESTTYDVTGTDANGCTNSASIDIIVNELPAVVANSDATDAQVCKGSNITLTGSGAESYTWDNSVTDGVAFAPAATGTFTVTGTDANGCVNTTTIDIKVNELPVVSATADNEVVCKGSEVTLTGSGADTYSWDNGVIDGVAFAPSATATFTVTGTDVNGCVNTATIEITVNNLPVVTANADNAEVCKNAEVTLTGSGAESYTWDNSVTDGVPFAATSTLTYTVTGTDANGCKATDEVTVTVDICNGIAKPSNTISLEVYPNPNNGKFTLQFDTKKSQVIEVIVYDSKGQIQYRSSETPFTGQVSKNLDLNLTKGIYQIQLISDDVNSTQKFVVN